MGLALGTVCCQVPGAQPCPSACLPDPFRGNSTPDISDELRGPPQPNHLLRTSCQLASSLDGLHAADAWLRQNVPALLTFVSQRDGQLAITFEEGANHAATPTDHAMSDIFVLH